MGVAGERVGGEPLIHGTQADPKPKFQAGEGVLCFPGPLLYEAKCVKGQKDKQGNISYTTVVETDIGMNGSQKAEHLNMWTPICKNSENLNGQSIRSKAIRGQEERGCSW